MTSWDDRLSYCKKCGTRLTGNDRFCASCGAPIKIQEGEMERGGLLIVTTPHVPGHRVVKILDVVSGLTARTRGIGGKFLAGFQSMIGGEVSAFTYEMEKARREALMRLSSEAERMGANAVIGLDIETSDVFQGVVLISVTGTAVVVEPED